jgi:hypothetical protein
MGVPHTAGDELVGTPCFILRGVAVAVAVVAVRVLLPQEVEAEIPLLLLELLLPTELLVVSLLPKAVEVVLAMAVAAGFTPRLQIGSCMLNSGGGAADADAAFLVFLRVPTRLLIPTSGRAAALVDEVVSPRVGKWSGPPI